MSYHYEAICPNCKEKITAKHWSGPEGIDIVKSDHMREKNETEYTTFSWKLVM